MSGIDYQTSLNNYQTNGNSNFFIFNSGGGRQNSHCLATGRIWSLSHRIGREEGFVVNGKEYRRTKVTSWRSCCVHDELVMARSGDHRPSVSRGINASRALSREWDLLCFLNFYWISLKHERTCLQWIRKESYR